MSVGDKPKGHYGARHKGCFYYELFQGKALPGHSGILTAQSGKL
jgi:hypothetical protein